jgi:hypothetical protein
MGWLPTRLPRRKHMEQCPPAQLAELEALSLDVAGADPCWQR